MSNTPKLNENTAPANQSDLARTLGFIIAFFGVFFSLIGFFSMLTIVVLQSSSVATPGPMTENDIYATVLTISSLLFSFSAIYIGWKLIKQQDLGRKLFNAYTVIVFLASCGNYLYKQAIIARAYANIPPEVAAAARSAESSDTLILFILPAILLMVAMVLNYPRVKAGLR